MQRYSYSFLLCLLLYAFRSPAQNNELPYTTISMQNLNDFRPVGNNWKVAGEVFYDLKKGGEGKTKAGSGVLVNDPSGKSKDNLFTKMEHGDLELELDFMMDKGSNSGVYLQGRYEVQLFDSWGVQDPKYSDCGGIYERWDETKPEGQQGYQGHPPTQNVSRAPGLWQHYTILFRAPRFNEKGEKIENARFVKVIQNGVTIHENIEVTGPTRAAAFQDEKPTGPLMIQGDHGPVAIRNIRYKAYGIEPVTLTNLKLSAYEGKFNSLGDFASLTPKREMPIDVLAHLAPGSKDNFGGKITGTIHIPHSGKYLFDLNLAWIPAEVNLERLNGAGELKVGNQKIIAIDARKGGEISNVVDMQAGDYPFELTYYKNFGFWYARSNDIILSVEGPGVPYMALKPIIQVMEPVSEIALLTKSQPVMQRSFVNHQGQKHTHAISVGETGAANYSLDLRKGELLKVWRGDFLETTPMWHGRGETQLALPLGSVIELPGKPALTFLSDKNAAWPDSNATFMYQGYDVDKAGRPVFKYSLGGASIRESLVPEEDGKKLSHAFTVTPGQEKEEIWCRVAEGSDITELPNGMYAVNDRQYFIELPGKEKPVIRNTARNTKEMLLPVKAGSVKYAIVW